MQLFLPAGYPEKSHAGSDDRERKRYVGRDTLGGSSPRARGTGPHRALRRRVAQAHILAGAALCTCARTLDRIAARHTSQLQLLPPSRSPAQHLACSCTAAASAPATVSTATARDQLQSLTPMTLVGDETAYVCADSRHTFFTREHLHVRLQSSRSLHGLSVAFCGTRPSLQSRTGSCRYRTVKPPGRWITETNASFCWSTVTRCGRRLSSLRVTVRLGVTNSKAARVLHDADFVTQRS